MSSWPPETVDTGISIEPFDRAMRWHLPTMLRWIDHNRGAERVPSGELVGQVLQIAAERIERQAAQRTESCHVDQDLPTVGGISAIWRNGVTNTAAVIDIARRRFRELVKLTPRERGAIEAFDGFLDKAVQDWFDATRKASPTTYDEAEQVYKDHAAGHADQVEG